MTRYERLTLSVDDGVCHAPGRIVEVLESPRGGRNQITALVAVPTEETTTTPSTGSGDGSQGVADETFFCQGDKANGDPCSREVDEPGERCFQHPKEDE